MRKALYISALIFGCIGTASAQLNAPRQVIGTAGTTFVTTSSGATVSQTIGESVVGTVAGNDLELTQGFQQPLLDLTPPDELYYFNAFSPDNDGTNDLWMIPDLEFYPNNSVVIFNRYGDVIQTYQNYDNSTVVWDGTDANGNVLPHGTYFFVIEYDDGPTRKGTSGWVQLMK